MSFRAVIRSLVFLLMCVPVRTAQQRDADLARYSDQAREALASKKWDEAVKALQHLAQLAPSVPEVQANLGMALFFEGHATEALAAFDRARKLNPATRQVDLMIGLCQAELGRHQEAVAILAPAFDHPPDAETGRLIGLHLARSYSELRQFDKALAAGEELLKRYPDDPEVLFQVSRLHADRSYRLMKQLLQAAPDSYWVHLANAQVQESLQRYDLAQQEYRKAIELNPNAPGAHVGLGRAILSVSKDSKAMDEASREFERELALSPENAIAEFELGEIAREHGQPDRAREHLLRAVRYNQDFFEAQVALGRLFLKEGKAREAIAHLEVAAHLEPRDKLSHYLLASAHKSLGDQDAARRELELYRKLGASGKQNDASEDDHLEP
jgi:tetratricopeptide (TPR) repeat protein